MYGLKEAGIIAFKNLVQNLKPHGYSPMKYTPGLWRHKTKPTTFTLCVDDFSVKYFTPADAHHLINAIKTKYECTIDWSRSMYVGINLKWNYEKGYVDTSMEGLSPVLSKNITILHQKNHNTHLTTGRNLSTDKAKPNKLPKQHHHLFLDQTVSSASKE